MSAQVAADLRAAAEVLRRDGWTQGIYHAVRGCHCAEGAIGAAIGQHVYQPDVDVLIAQALHLGGDWWTVGDRELWARRGDAEDAVIRFLGLVDGDGVADWNDAPGRTADEVIAALLAAADADEATS